MVQALQEEMRQRKQIGPQTDDELWDHIKQVYGIEIPRVAVCDDHVSPFDFLSDIFFERVISAIAVANRGGSKTFISALLHRLFSKFRAGCESATVGAIEQQSLRAYHALLALLKKEVGKPEATVRDHPDVLKSVQRETSFRNDSKVEVLPGTVPAVNGPHPQKVHADEVELMDPVVFDESRNMSQSKNGIIAQDWITSTRKRAHGPMQKLLNEIIEAKRVGAIPPYEIYTWCIFETSQNVPNCRIANPNLPEDQKCQCDKVVKGTWDDGSTRKFSDVCRGRLARSQGFAPLSDVHKLFRNNSREVWEAQQECSRPETAGLVLPMFSRERYGIKWYEPDPDNGPIYIGVDFGGTNPHAVNWYQVLNRDVFAYSYNQSQDQDPMRLLKAGTRVGFDEVYISEVANTDVARLIWQHNDAWAIKYPNFRHRALFADPAAKAARLEFAKYDRPLGSKWMTTRDQKEHIKTVKDLLNSDRFVVDVNRCPMFCDEAEDWHYPKKKEEMIYDPEIPVDDFNHCMANWRYTMSNLRTIERRQEKAGIVPSAADVPGRTQRGVRDWTKSGASRYLPREEDQTGLPVHPLSGRVVE